MPAKTKPLPAEKEIKDRINNLLAKEHDFTTPKSKMVFLNKLHQYQKMLLALQDGHPDKWPEYGVPAATYSA